MPLSHHFHPQRVYAGNQIGEAGATFQNPRQAIFLNALVWVPIGSAKLAHYLLGMLRIHT